MTIERNEAVLTHLTAAAQKISPCPDDGRLHPADGEVASAFRATHGRWPLWWEMAVEVRNAELEAYAHAAELADASEPAPDESGVDEYDRHRDAKIAHAALLATPPAERAQVTK